MKKVSAFISAVLIVLSCTVSVFAADTDIKGIEIENYPTKKEYIETEEIFDPSGLTVNKIFANGSKEQLSLSECQIFTESFNSIGTKNVTVQYRPTGYTNVFSAAFTVSTVKIPVKSLTADTANVKTEYIENTPLDLSGISLKMTYSDGRKERTFSKNDILSGGDFTVTVDGKTDTSKLTVGKHTVKIQYRDAKYYPCVEFNINVRRKKLTSLEIAANPKSLTVYHLDKIPSLDGLTLTATYDNGEKETLTASDCDVACSLPLHYGSGNTVTVSYTANGITMKQTFDFTAYPLEEKRLKLTLPQVLTFILGEEIDLSALKVEVEYNDGSVKEITDYEISKIEPLNTEKVGQDVVVTYGKFSEIFTVYIVPYYQRGDIDGDGQVTVKDARYALRQSVGLIQLASKPLAAADANKDGNVTVGDARLILRGAVGLEKLPLALYAVG